MPDTGAPWNIPYVAASDLVKDWPTDNQTMAEAIADALDAASVVRQVVSTVKLDTFTTASDTFVDVTGLSVTITPQDNTNKVLLIASFQLATDSNTGNSAYVQLAGGNAGTYIGDAASSRVRAAASTGQQNTDWNVAISSIPTTLVYLDSPATASATTYKVQLRRRQTGSVFIGRTGSDNNDDGYGRFPSSITAIEVSA